MRVPVATKRARGRSFQLTAERVVNVFAEAAPAESKSPVVMHGSPGLTTWSTLDNGPVQSAVNWLGVLYALSGGHLYRLDSSGFATDLGNTGIIGEASIRVSSNQLVICDSGFGYLDGFFVYGNVTVGWIYTVDDGLSRIRDDAFASFGPSSFFISAIGDAGDIDGLDFASAEALPDIITNVTVDHRQVWIFGANSVEIWHNTGDATFPLTRLEGATYERYGCVAPQTIQSFDNQLAYLDTFGIVRLGAVGQSPKRISTHAIEYQIAQAKDTSNAYALVYIQEGHEFYALTIPQAGTFVYDAATRLWSERVSPGLDVWRPRCYVEAYGQKLVGDAANGRLWQLSLDTYDEDGDPLIATLVFPPIQNDGGRFTLHEYQLDFEVGTGSKNSVNPMAMLEASRDGRTWIPLEDWRSLGDTGSYQTRVIWRRLGQYRTFHSRVSISAPVKRALYAVYARMEPNG